MFCLMVNVFHLFFHELKVSIGISFFFFVHCAHAALWAMALLKYTLSSLYSLVLAPPLKHLTYSFFQLGGKSQVLALYISLV